MKTILLIISLFLVSLLADAQSKTGATRQGTGNKLMVSQNEKRFSFTIEKSRMINPAIQKFTLPGMNKLSISDNGKSSLGYAMTKNSSKNINPDLSGKTFQTQKEKNNHLDSRQAPNIDPNSNK